MRPILLSLLTLAILPTGAVAASCPEVPTTMRAIELREYGGPERLKLATRAVEPPAAGEVLVAVHASSVNPIDWKLREGYAKDWWPLELPAVVGLDVSGVVAAVGEGTVGWKCGDAVVAYLGQKGRGAYAEYVRVPALQLARKPASIDFAAAGAYPLVSLTAWQGVVEKGALAAGERVLVHGGAGGVGGFAVQIAKARGAYVVATASKRNHEYLKSIGADEVVDYKATRFEDSVADIDLVFDTAGGDTTARSIEVLAAGGRLVTIAGALPMAACRERGFTCLDMLVEPDAADLAEIGALIDAGKLRVDVERVFPLERAGEAQELNRAGGMRGKIAIAIREPAQP